MSSESTSKFQSTLLCKERQDKTVWGNAEDDFNPLSCVRRDIYKQGLDDRIKNFNQIWQIKHCWCLSGRLFQSTLLCKERLLPTPPEVRSGIFQSTLLCKERPGADPIPTAGDNFNPLSCVRRDTHTWQQSKEQTLFQSTLLCKERLAVNLPRPSQLLDFNPLSCVRRDKYKTWWCKSICISIHSPV